MDEYLQESSFQSDFNENGVSFEKWDPLKSNLNEPETNSSGGGFECNICLDLVQDPVVTLCGHLYCWRCIYQWIISSQNENPDTHKPNCPVCKTEVSQKTVIPLYGRGQYTSSSNDKASSFGTLVPQRPSSPRCCDNMLLPNTTTTTNQMAPHRANYLADPMIGMFGEMLHSRIFGNSETSLYRYPNSYHLEGGNSLRLRRRMSQADRSLSRVCFFLCCCVMLCLLLF